MTAAANVARFSRVQVEMLECVYQHRLLSTAQVHALYRDALSLRRTQRGLAAMERVGWLEAVRLPGGMKLWFVTERGADAVESIGNRAELRRKVIPREQAAGPLQQHTLAVNEVGVAFVRAARERPPDEFGPLSWRNEIAHPIGPRPGRRGTEMLIADAELTYLQVLDDRVRLHWALVEVDRATMALETLVSKLGRYVRMYEYAGPPGRRRIGAGPLWREHYPDFPTLLVVLANASHRRLWNRRWLIQSLWERDHADSGERIDVRVCIYSELMEHGPFAPVFMDDRQEMVDWLGRSPDAPDEPEEETVEDESQPAPAEEIEPAPDPWERW
jgi:hypothetical protein